MRRWPPQLISSVFTLTQLNIERKFLLYFLAFSQRVIEIQTSNNETFKKCPASTANYTISMIYQIKLVNIFFTKFTC